jgi:sugar phosphate permease
VLWAVLFYRWYRDRPEDHPGVNDAERALLHGREAPTAHGPVPWGLFLRSRTVWLLWGQYMCINYGWAFYYTWLPTYLHDARGVSLKAGALLAGIPLFFGGLGSLLSGAVSGPLARRLGDVARARRALAVTGCIGAAVALAASMQLRDPLAAMLVMGLASFCNDLAMPSAWATCMDVGGRYAGTLSGSMNMMGNIVSGLSGLLVGFILEWTGGMWATTFYLGAGTYALGAVCWWFLRSARRLDGAAVLPVAARGGSAP